MLPYVNKRRVIKTKPVRIRHLLMTIAVRFQGAYCFGALEQCVGDACIVYGAHYVIVPSGCCLLSHMSKRAFRHFLRRPLLVGREFLRDVTVFVAVLRAFETLVPAYRSTRRHIPENYYGLPVLIVF
jgi:hypothetical protein